jgi:nanoRNase/pAp phosphatase (c-di-AMP/oligoRNAs hydrolase)
MNKRSLETIHEKNTIINRIIDTLQEREQFLILGHKNPDEDCVASMVSFALIVSKFSKKVCLYFSDPMRDHFEYLLNICAHNAILLCGQIDLKDKSFDTIVICDTPKLSMVDTNPQIDFMMNNTSILKIEIDHHLGGDSSYIGGDGYCLVTEATSSSELVGTIALKLNKRADILSRYNIQNPLSRNVILSVLTGIVGDTSMGQYIKSRRQKKYYDYFSNLYNNMLMKETTKETNLMNKDEVFREIQRFSAVEEECFHFINGMKKFSGSIGYVILDKKKMDYLTGKFDNDTIVSVTRSVADSLAEESTRLGLIAYDDSNNTNMIQFRLRRGQGFKSFDLRRVLNIFSIKEGGGHEGAIGFRIKKGRVENIEEYVEKLIFGIEKAISM